MNHVLASRGSQKGKILEHWSSLRSLRDYLEANVPRVESEHTAWKGCQVATLSTRSFPSAPRTPATRKMSLPPVHDCTLRGIGEARPLPPQTGMAFRARIRAWCGEAGGLPGIRQRRLK